MSYSLTWALMWIPFYIMLFVFRFNHFSRVLTGILTPFRYYTPSLSTCCQRWDMRGTREEASCPGAKRSRKHGCPEARKIGQSLAADIPTLLRCGNVLLLRCGNVLLLRCGNVLKAVYLDWFQDRTRSKRFSSKASISGGAMIEPPSNEATKHAK